MSRRFTYLSSAVLAACLPMAAAANDDIDPKRLLSMSLEELTNIEVTSVSKRSEKASEAAAAVFVITQDDIRRSGATSIPEALRIAPGIDVARAGAHQWAVSSRGFNGQFANKLIVLIDGRSVYTPWFSGVWWDAQDTLLEDIERIEVIRGPGGTIWGANAVNGVINIITKQAKDTQGGLVTATSGNQERALVGGRYGLKVGENTHFRGYAKYTNRDEEYAVAGGGAGDHWTKTQVGFRSDTNLAENASFTIQGDAYRSNEDFPVYLPSFTAPPAQFVGDGMDIQGANILGRWKKKWETDAETTFQFYVDNAKRDTVVYKHTINTFDFDLQHAFKPSERHEIVMGAGYRAIDARMAMTPYYTNTPSSPFDDILSAFIQDKIAIVPKEFFLTLGSKFEHNDYTGFEIQPSARLTWLPAENQTVWASVSRAVRTPSIFTEYGRLTVAANQAPLPAGFAVSEPNKALESEEVIAYELGYRIQPIKTVSLDAAAFYNDYDKLFTTSVGAPFLQTSGAFAPFFQLPLPVVNGNSARSYGFELAANWDVTPIWKLASSYSYIDLRFDRPFLVGFSFAGQEPQQQFNVRSTLFLPYNLEMNNTVYYTDSLTGGRVPDYVRFDTRIAWQATGNIELSLVGQNLLDNRHPEFSGFLLQTQEEIGRSVYGNVRIKF